ncbi:MAG: TIGR03936 family radical SAM-associated protein [Clostridia bacterium]
MRIIARFAKGDAAKFTSHLDLQRLFIRAFSRAKLKVAFSQGFNPHPKLSFATALSLGMTSSAEWLDIKFETNIRPLEFIDKLNENLPDGIRIISAFIADDSMKALTALTLSADYEVDIPGFGEDALKNAAETIMSGSIVVRKRGKAGVKDIDIRGQVHDLKVSGEKLLICGELGTSGALNIELFMDKFFEALGEHAGYSAKRTEINFSGGFLPAF